MLRNNDFIAISIHGGADVRGGYTGFKFFDMDQGQLFDFSYESWNNPETLEHYLNDNDDITNWKISPLLYSDFYGMPITYIYGAGLDPLVDEGYALMKRLKSFENEVYYKVYEGQMHAFVSNIVSLPTSIDCINEASEAIKKIIQIN